MASSSVTYTSGTNNFNITFGYLRDTHVIVQVGSTQYDINDNYFTIDTTSTPKVVLTTAVSDGTTVKILRKSLGKNNDQGFLVDFVDGSVLTEKQQDEAYQHNYYINQESKEGNLSVGTPLIDSDAANKGYVDQAIADAALNNLGGNVSLDAVSIANTPATGYELTVDGQALIGANTLTGTGATDNSTGGTPFDSTYGPSGTHPAEVIITQGADSTGTSLLVQSSGTNDDATSVDNATLSIQASGEPLLQLFDTNGTGNISHIYHKEDSFNVDWSMTNGSTGAGNTHKILRATASHDLAMTVNTSAMGVGTGTAQMGGQMINFYIDGSALKVQYVAPDGATTTTGTVATLS
tara:strand:- start:815 stop:1867 length:1053 start_codon:yes stop_codon:yes gene_type:complete